MIGLDGSTILWTLHKNGHVARCSAVKHPLGLEMRWEWNGELYFSRVFPESGDELLKESESKKTELEAKGWIGQV